MSTARILTPSQRTAVIADPFAAQSLAQKMPRLAAEARRIAATAAAGVHGRRRTGQGDSFWQFREFGVGEAVTRIDWRRSARDNHLYVREREWEAATNMWLWVDRSPSMAFISKLATQSKLERAIILTLAIADMLVRGGERAGLHSLTPPQASRKIIERLGEALILDEKAGVLQDMPQAQPIGARDEIVLIGDFITDLDVIGANLEAVSSRGGRGHLVLVRDPIEEVFPFKGETEFEDPQSGERLQVGDAVGFATQYKNRIEAHTQGLRMITDKLGWTLTLHRTDRPATEPLFALMMLLQGRV
jgi:uncharacterized protein (DUF58 family)